MKEYKFKIGAKKFAFLCTFMTPKKFDIFKFPTCLLLLHAMLRPFHVSTSAHTGCPKKQNKIAFIVYYLLVCLKKILSSPWRGGSRRRETPPACSCLAARRGPAPGVPCIQEGPKSYSIFKAALYLLSPRGS